MHVKSKMMAFGGLSLALCILFMALGSVFETGTLFFLAASSFFVGIMIREMGMKMGLAFYLAAVLLGFIIAPNKFYVVTFGAMGLYILVIEGAWRLLARNPGRFQKRDLFWGIKYLVFNVMYIPAVLLFLWSGLFSGQACIFSELRAKRHTLSASFLIPDSCWHRFWKDKFVL